MNNLPNMKIDSGTTRRIKAYEHKSKFVDDEQQVDNKNNVYLKDVSLLSKIKACPDLLNAIFKIIADYCKLYIMNPKIEYSSNFENTKKNCC